MLLIISGFAKSTYYYNLKSVDKDTKNRGIIETIEDIFTSSKKRYSYRRCTFVLNNKGKINPR